MKGLTWWPTSLRLFLVLVLFLVEIGPAWVRSVCSYLPAERAAMKKTLFAAKIVLKLSFLTTYRHAWEIELP